MSQAIASQRQYLEQSGSCPVCQSQEIEGDSYEGDGDAIYMKITCLSCEATWQDVYRLTGYCELQDKDENSLQEDDVPSPEFGLPVPVENGPFGLRFDTDGQVGTLRTKLREELVLPESSKRERKDIGLAVDLLEGFLLALGNEGVNLGSPMIEKTLETALTGFIENRL
jgi:hypothetical protein